MFASFHKTIAAIPVFFQFHLSVLGIFLRISVKTVEEPFCSCLVLLDYGTGGYDVRLV